MSIYGVALGMTFPLLFLPSALIGSLATALVPDISMALVKNDNKHIEKRVKSSLSFALFVSFLIVPVFIAIGDRVGMFLYNDALSGTLLQYSAWIMIPMGISNIASAILNSVGLEVKSFVNFVIGDIVMFLAIFILPKYIGINALIVGMGASAVIASTLNLLMLKRKLKINIGILKKLVTLAFLSLPTVALTAFFSSLLSYVMPNVLNILISALIGVGCFILLCVVFNVVNFSVYMVQFKEKFASKKGGHRKTSMFLKKSRKKK